MLQDYKKLSTEELVDLLAQKTQKITQLLVVKTFDEEYKESKNTIQQILAEIELRKKSSIKGDHQSTQQPSIS